MRFLVVLVVAAVMAGCIESAPVARDISDAPVAPPPEQDLAPTAPVEYAAQPTPAVVDALHDAAGPSSVVLRIHEAPGYEALDAAAESVVAELSRALQKPVAWERVPVAAGGDAESRWTTSELSALGRELSAAAWPDDKVVLHAVSLPGCFTMKGRDCVAGVEIANVAYVFFDGHRDETSVEATRDQPYVGERSIQRYILLHELGHAIGLVNREVPALATDRISDDACQCHSTNEHSVMRGRGGTNISGEHGHDMQEIQDLLADERWNHVYDEDDIADIRAFQASL